MAIAVDNLANAHELTKDEEEEQAAEAEVILQSYLKRKKLIKFSYRNVNVKQKILIQCLN